MHLMYTLHESGKRVYTLKKIVEGEVTKSAHPARFSPDDKYSRQRVTLKKRYGLLMTQQQTHATAIEKSPFQKLSAELRNRIWEFAIIEEDPIRVVSPPAGLRATAVDCIQPAITRTCAQIRNEALGMFYAKNTFLLKISCGDDLNLAVGNSWKPDLEHNVEHHISKACRWLTNSPRYHHDAISSLVLVKHLEYFALHEGDVLYPFKDSLFGLAKALKSCGYDGARLKILVKVIVVMDFFTDKDEAAIMRAFESLGMDVSLQINKLSDIKKAIEEKTAASELTPEQAEQARVIASWER